MDKILQEALRLSKLGFSVIPVNEHKNPAISFWRTYQTRPMTEQEVKKHFDSAFGIALLTGGKNRITAIDFDTKYFTDKGLMERIKEFVPIKLLKKMKVAQTTSGGFHWLFKCSKVEPNQKLANRPTTESEVMKTFAQELDKLGDINQAMKNASNDKCKVLVETRGGTESTCGGYVCVAPTPGYKWIYGTLQEILVEEYDLLMETMRGFNEYVVPFKNAAMAKVDSGSEESPFNDFNERGDIISILEDNGWTVKDRRGKNVRLLRPGQVHSQSSALYDSDSKVMTCFSTSTALECNKGYTHVDLLMELEGLNIQECYKRLVDLGYGKV